MTRVLLPSCLFLLAIGPWAQAQPLKPLAEKTLKRVHDTVVIEGKHLTHEMRGAHKSRYRVYACRSGVMTPIQFQIDERSQTGGFCYDQGPKDRRVADYDQGKLDSNDELVVCARDAGERADPKAFAMIPGYTAVQELVLRDPLDGGLGWIYVFRFDDQPLPGKPGTDYVSLQVKHHNDEERTYYWRGEGFAFNNDRSRRNAVRATFATLVKRDQSPKQRPNMLDSTQVRAVVSFMWVTIVRQSNDIRVNIGGYIDGPLRMVTENLLKVYLALGLWVSAPDSYVILWRNKVSMPTNANNPVNLDTSDESSYTLCMDLSPTVKGQGWQFYNSHNKTPVVIDGKMSPAEQKLVKSYPDWNCIYNPKMGAMISKFVVPDFMGKKRKTSKLLYIDNEKYERPEDEEGIEFEPGAMGYHGYYVDMAGLKKGVYPGDYLVWYAEPPFAPGDEAGYVNEYDHPLEIVSPADGASEQK